MLCLLSSKYLLSFVTRIIIFQKQECVEPRPEEMKMLVKRFLCSFYIHNETLVNVELSLIQYAHNSCVTEKKQVVYMNCNSLDNDYNADM